MKRIYLLLFYFLFWTAFHATAPANASNEITRLWNGNIIIKAHDSTLVEIFKEPRGNAQAICLLPNSQSCFRLNPLSSSKHSTMLAGFYITFITKFYYIASTVSLHTILHASTKFPKFQNLFKVSNSNLLSNFL